MKRTTPSVSKWLTIGLPSLIVIIWFAIAGVGGPYFGKISEQSSNDLTTFLPENAESTKVQGQLKNFRDDETIPAIVVFEATGSKVSSEDVASLDAISTKVAAIDGVVSEPSPAILSDDKKAVLVAIPLVQDGDFASIVSSIKTTIDAEKPASLEYKITGPASFALDIQNAFAGIDGTLLVVALSVVFVILLVVYRSPLLPFLVLFTSLAALCAAIVIVYYLAVGGIIDLNGQVQGILFILVIGAATDYSLLYVSRYREELTRHATAWKATLAAMKASFEPVLAAGGTVAVGLLCLLASDLNSNKALGPVGAVGVSLSIVAALTLLPAFLLLFRRAVFWPQTPRVTEKKSKSTYQYNHKFWSKIGTFVSRYPRRIWTTTAAVLLVSCLGLFQLNANGASQSDLVLGPSEARDGQEILDRHFASGSGSPTYIIVNDEKRDQVVRSLDANSNVDSVSVSATNTNAGAIPIGQAKKDLESEIRTEVKTERAATLSDAKKKIENQLQGQPSFVIENAIKNVEKNIPSVDEIAKKAYPFKNAPVKQYNGQNLLQVTLTQPADSLGARDSIQSIRDEVEAIDSSALTGGTTAAQYDTNVAAERDQRVIIPLILIAITIILMVLLRAVVAPILLLLTTVVSFGATLGIAALLFNHVWQFPGADPSVVIFGFVFLVALGIDYNIFLMTRVREETIKLGVKEGTIKGLVVTGGVITSAGIVLAATFAALGVIPVLFLAQIAFIVAFGVLVDTIVVRSLLVPALTLDIGKLMWWPSSIWRKK